ncbi:MAG: GIY-YIG nuclease family protein [Gemmataceae bacterium]|nr:GIY-YIG nuclease family protein [Gemmataceae bacterium]
MIRILDFLTPRGLDPAAKVKLVRHQDKRFDMVKLERDGLVEVYQSYQLRPVFECDFMVSFIGLENSRARFFGVYRVVERLNAVDRPLPAGFAFPGFSGPDHVYYVLDRQTGFDDLIGRMVIDWGSSPLAWHQWLDAKNDKEVVEILPAGYVRDFPGYLDFVISFDELVGIVKNPAANREWHRRLSAVAGVYLIVDGKSGKQYVGSAYGVGGILARWKVYAASGHGGNQQLTELVDADSGYAKNFTFTLLRTLPLTLTRAEVIEYESLYKRKLGSRAFGLNLN